MIEDISKIPLQELKEHLETIIQQKHNAIQDKNYKKAYEFRERERAIKERLGTSKPKKIETEELG